MSWNEAKVGLAPIGSKVYESRDRSTKTEDGYPVTVLEVYPFDAGQHQHPKTLDLERWLMVRGFRTISKKPQSSRFDSNDISVRIFFEGDFLREISLNFQVGLDARDRLVFWGQFVKELCESHHFELIDAEVGLVEPIAFEGLVKRSFAWQSFLERENPGHKGTKV